MNMFKATMMILDLAKDFEGRLEEYIIFDVRDWVDHNEPGLAFNVLHNQLYEFSISISADECKRLDEVCKLLQYDKQGPEYNYSPLTELIERPDDSNPQKS